MLDKLRQVLSSHYRVEREVGAGGMATVYLAHDLKHDRRVAIKVLRPELAAAVGSERFLREIKVTAALQHPHILPLFDSGIIDGTVYYVMPFVEGESLRTRLERVRQLPVAEALDIARAVASALDHAHRRGIVHRDIKPENILIGMDALGGEAGLQTLVADFGVAVAMEGTNADRLTGTGVSIGTPTYMSPEQASAERTLGPSSDVYALGVVLYEMLAGEPPFTGPTSQAIVARIMTETPAALRLRRPAVANGVEAAVSRALAKVPADRFQTAAQFAEALRDGAYVAGLLPAPARPRRTVVPWLLVAALAALSLFLWFRQAVKESDEVPVRTTLLPPAGEEFSDRRNFGALSQDGRRFAFVVQPTNGPPQLWVRDLARMRAELLTGTAGASAPFWSPDGSTLAYFADGQLFRVSASGGTPERIAEASPGSTGAWGKDGTIYFTMTHGVMGVSASARGQAAPRLVLRADSGRLLARPSVSEDGHYLVLTTGVGQLVVGDIRNGTMSTVRGGAFDAQFAGGNVLAYVGERAGLQLQRIDLAGAAMIGDPVEVGGSVRAASNQMSFTTSRTGRIAYLLERLAPGPLVVDRTGAVLDTIARSASLPTTGHRPESMVLGGNAGLFRYDLTRKLATLLHRTPGLGVLAMAWSPDDSRIAFSDWCALRVIGLDGGGLRRIVEAPPTECLRVTDWWMDDRVLVTKTFDAKPSEVWEYDLDDGSGTLRISGSAGAADATVSPDGRTVAYTSSTGLTYEVFVRPLLGAGAGQRVSTDGGRSPRWSHDGRELFFVTPSGNVMSASVSGAAASMSIPRVLFQAAGWERSFFASIGFRPFDVSPDGQQFYLVQSPTEGSAVLVQGALSLLSSRGQSP